MSEPSGPQWCARYPGSADSADLTRDFRDVVRAFLSQLKDAGAAVSVSATYRPPERGYLMHWCWMIAREGFNPASVPPKVGVNVGWLHRTDAGAPDLAASRAASDAMVRGYGLTVQPSLTSLHIVRRAIDMSIAWQGDLNITDFNGIAHTIRSLPRNGSNAELVLVGATFGVFKLLSDPPHWSDDGH